MFARKLRIAPPFDACRPRYCCCFWCGDADLDRKERDESFRVLQKCAAEMSVATRRLYHLSLVQGDFGITSNVIPQYASLLRYSQVDCGFEMDTEALA